jgi:type II secretory pathway pseudopilin PulG
VFTVTVIVEVEGAVVVVVGGVVPVPPDGGGVVVVVVIPAVAVTFAVRFVVRMVVAMPDESVFDTLALSDPASVVKVTGIPFSTLPPVSLTLALIVESPPRDDTSDGLALATTALTAADPTAILIVLAAATLDPPEVAVIVATPDVVPELKRVTARPLTSVWTSGGSKLPRLAMNVTCVPLCGAVPAGSMTWATICAVSLNPKVDVAVVSVMVDPVGAISGTFSQAEETSISAANATHVQTPAARNRDSMKALSILVPMNLAGQDRFRPIRRAQGYAMVALLIAMSIMAVMMTVAMPVWKQMAQREKEEELVFRGNQYVHAISLYGRKFANTQPPSIDVLVQGRFLRKKYKDPITNDDFVPVTANTASPGSPGGANPGSTGGAQGRVGAAPSVASAATPGGISQNTPGAAPQSGGRGISPIGTPGSQPAGGIIGVASKSKDRSIRVYNGRTHYNEWAFTYQPQTQTPGGGVPGSGVPGGIPGRGGPGGRGGGPGPIGPGGRGPGPQRGGPGGPGFPRGGFPGGGPGFPTNPSPPPPTRGRG